MNMTNTYIGPNFHGPSTFNSMYMIENSAKQYGKP